MEPIGVDFKKKKGDMILHKCGKCGKEMLNQVAPDDRFLEFVRSLNKESAGY
jgi:hypothetical protein